MKIYKDFPEKGELVVIEIEDVNPHSVYAKLEGYDLEGMIHISEVSRSWVRDIKKEVKEGEKDVAQVLEINKDKKQLGLSLKRVNEKQKREKMQEWKKEMKADKLLEKVADITGKDMEDLYEEVAFPLQKEFDNTFDGFQAALNNTDEVEEIIGKDLTEAVKNVAEKNISLKNIEMESVMEIEVPDPDGIDIIKSALQVEEKAEISYLSAPKYKIKAWGINRKSCKDTIKKNVEKIRKDIEDKGGTFSVKKN